MLILIVKALPASPQVEILLLLLLCPLATPGTAFHRVIRGEVRGKLYLLCPGLQVQFISVFNLV